MKRHLDPSKTTTTPAPTCWQREAPSPCLRIEPGGREAHLFPYQQLITITFVHSDGTDTLRLVFASHEVEVTGRNLRDLLHALQEFAVKWVRPVPERYQVVNGGEGQGGIVTSIRITAAG
jgi:hypothetical protein